MQNPRAEPLTPSPGDSRSLRPRGYTVRLCRQGAHLFDRYSGLNVLLDEVHVPLDQLSRAPRYMSVALTNACDLRCHLLLRPKHAATLDADQVIRWATELDSAVCLGIGLGGGEPTTHPASLSFANGSPKRHPWP